MIRIAIVCASLLLLSACQNLPGAVTGATEAVRAVADKKTAALLLAHETASIARCLANASSMARVMGLERARELTDFCLTLGAQQREALDLAPD